LIAYFVKLFALLSCTIFSTEVCTGVVAVVVCQLLSMNGEIILY